ncbi:MAG: hypothetical protein PHV18_10890 [Lachnospiraceae bacterium]|nr:hypothetical protein [Lachnospiraceae bacterium]
MNDDRKLIFPVITGIEVAFSSKPEQERCVHSELAAVPSTLIFQKSVENDILLVYQAGKRLPAPFAKRQRGDAILIAPDMVAFEDLQAFPELWDFIQSMRDKLYSDRQLCTVKLSPQMKDVFSELEQIPIPPTMFRFFIQLKVFEILLLLSAVNLYGQQVHFYPYAEI